MKNFISVKDVNDIDALVSKALHYKNNPLIDNSLGRDKKIGLIFLNPSMRTRISTQIAAKNLGMDPIVFNIDKEGWALEFKEGAIMNGNSVEHIKDAAPILGSYFDILCVRSFPLLKDLEEDYAENIINQFIKYAGIPIISLEGATLHPLQSLADIITIQEQIIKVPLLGGGGGKIVLSWAPHIKPLPQCVPNSFTQWINAWNKYDFVIAHPKGYELKEEFTHGAAITNNQEEALKDADFVYVKNWSAYNEYGTMPGENSNWMLNNKKLSITNNAKFMHCLPVRRNIELSDDILDGPNSLVTQQATNRIWAAQAVIAEILNRL